MINILEFLKNGSGIHIKKKNKGSFTRWCGGNVTEECIRRGKASSNPKIRRKATFADNARHFKHRLGGSIVEAFKLRRQTFKFGGSLKLANARKWKHEEGGSFKGYPSKAAYDVRLEEVAGFKKGGVFKAADGAKTNIWQKIGNGLNSGWGQLAINIGSSYLQNKAQNKQIDYNQEMSDASLDMEKNEQKKLIPYQAQQMAQQMLGPINPENPNEQGGIFAEVIPAKLRDLLNRQIDQEYANKKSLNKVQAQQLKNQNNSNFILGIGQNLGSMLQNINFSKKSNNQTTSIEQPVANNFQAGYNQFTQKPDYSYMLLQ